MGTTRATAILVAAAALLVAVAVAQAPAAAPGPDTSTTAAGAPGPSTVAGGPGPSAGQDCVNYLFNMSDCLTYVEEGSNLTAPDKACCPELAGLVESHPVCLCQLLGTNISASFGVQINRQKALNLPSVCAVGTPPISMCSVAGYPLGVPMPSEAPSPPGSTSPEASTPKSEATSPEASTPKSGASGIANVSQLLGFAIACLTTALVF
ncbi:non-specific lipid transfer protein GPI-anchored 12-like [Rhododendron vialii]|uniref:non-specific lipid transfer protein GPI-anchored 12-like n=1 Tax=Rhododendron vialii TaxID=182163 RepID=UPI00265F5FBC|nr:non-specific lipid transfer protein GPI-anchored 12-like [Rhododendron vialii]